MNDYEVLLLEQEAKAVSMPNGRKLRRKEKKLQSKVKSDLGKQSDFIVSRYRKITNKKSLSDDIDNIFDDLDDQEMIDDIIESQKDTLNFGANYRIKKSKLSKIGISFDIDHPDAVKFLQSDSPLQLAKLKETTKESIKPILENGVANGDSPQTIAKLIQESFALSDSRCMMIAVNETRRAYEYGNEIPLREAEKDGYKTVKAWNTVKDDRVTEECHANEQEGWIPRDQEHSSGDMTPPREGNPRCRCTEDYRIEI